MKLFPKRKTDDEYVEAVRKHAKCSKWVGVAFLLVFFLYAFCFCALWFSMAYSIDEYKEALAIKKFESLTAYIFESYDSGFGNGAMSFLPIFISVFSLGAAIIMLVGNRTANLIRKYYDEVKFRGGQETDGEGVEARRKKAKTAKWGGIIVFLFMSCLHVYLYFRFLFPVFASMKKNASDIEYFLDSWNAGFAYGAVSWLLMFVAVFFFGEAFTVLTGNILVKNLIKYYDKAKRNNEREE